MQRIAVIDYGMGNLRSVSKAIESVAPNDEVLVSSDVEVLKSADKVVCPGQGAAADCMQALKQGGFIDILPELLSTRPFMGICMGLQVLLSRSDENGGVDCTNVLSGTVKRFDQPLIDANGVRLKVPHMGWSPVEQTADHVMWNGIDSGARFYFAHSYYCVPDAADAVVGQCEYGLSFAVALASQNVFACQFHPEKSAKDGLQLLKNFTQWNGQ